MEVALAVGALLAALVCLLVLRRSAALAGGVEAGMLDR